MTSTQLNLDPGATKKYTPRDRLMRHQARDGCVKSPFKRIQSAWTQQCHIEGDSVDTIGALRPMGGIWASNNKSRASITLIIKFRDSPERGGHFEESPTEILQRMRFYKDRDSTKNEILQRTRFYKERDSTKNEILQNEEGTLKKARPRFYTSILQILRMRMPRSYRPRHDRLAPNQDREG